MYHPQKNMLRQELIDNVIESSIRLERALDQLSTYERIFEEFLNAIAHELRTPMQIILGNIEMIEWARNGDRYSEIDDSQGEFIKAIDKNAKRLHNTIENLICLSKENNILKIQ